MTLPRHVLLLILLSVLLSAVAQILMKLGMSESISARQLGAMASLGRAFSNPIILVGLGLYAGGAVSWLLVLSQVDVSLAYPFVGAGFVLTLALAWAFLGERFGIERLVGTALICAGIAVLTRS